MKQMKILTAAAIVSAIAFASTQMGAQDNTARETRDRARNRRPDVALRPCA
jgi:uncharacterized protein YdeI (BOF family)